MPVIHSRAWWRARPPRPGRQSQSDSQITEFFLHHPADPHGLANLDTQMEEGRYARAVQNFHMDVHKWNDIGYSFLVFQNGSILRGRGRTIVPAAQLGHNTGTIAVMCAVGNGETPSPKLYASLAHLKDRMDNLVGRDLRVRAHSEVTQTECPGPQIRALIPRLGAEH